MNFFMQQNRAHQRGDRGGKGKPQQTEGQGRIVFGNVSEQEGYRRNGDQHHHRHSDIPRAAGVGLLLFLR